MKTDKKISIKDIYNYFIGNYRYMLFYSNFAFLIRPYIKEQIEVRIKSMSKKCYSTGQCTMCGCKTTALQMANKACDKPCYPKMMKKSLWKWVQLGYPILDRGTGKYWQICGKKFKEVKSWVGFQKK